jgi:methylenetetrahydrofolate--tRNA-(uracil-5-)-methyltransferase
MSEITIIGGGLAGSEAAWQAAERGAKVTLYEMRPVVQTEVHKTGLLAELVCSNSLRAKTLERGSGILKEEMRRLGSLVIRAADESEVPGGGALAVDRDIFAAKVTEAVEQHPNVTVIRQEVTEIPDDGIVIVASGPLTTSGLAKAIYALTGQHYLFFYDAVSPIVDADTIDRDRSFLASRYEKGEAAYLNCPLTEPEYDRFYEALIHAETVQPRDFEKRELFEGCLPIEVIAKRGRQSLLFGPMKPVGLVDPKTGRRPFAVVQLRPENNELTMYNLVGFQTSLTWGEQDRVFRLIPALANAEFLRYGVVHRNTYIMSPALLNPTYQFRRRNTLFFAGQITGVEGYVESAASGLVAGVNAARLALGGEPVLFPRESMIGALARYVATASPADFQPMNANFGVLPPLESEPKSKKDKKLAFSHRALEAIEAFKPKIGL